MLLQLKESVFGAAPPHWGSAHTHGETLIHVAIRHRSRHHFGSHAERSAA